MIAVIGCGFLGSIYTEEVCKRLYAAEQMARFLFIDDDHFEPRNAANQNVCVMDAMARTAKADVMVDVALNNAFDADAVATRLTEDNIDKLLGTANFIVNAVDNLATRQLLWEYGAGHGIPVLHLGLSMTGCGVVQWTVAPRHDTFALSPIRTVGKTIVDPAGGEPPCKLAAMRSAGWLTGFAGAIATAIYRGFDAEGYVADITGEQGPFIGTGWVTDWAITPEALTPKREVWQCLGQP